MNVQYAVKGDRVFLIEVNPRASRTVPYVEQGHRACRSPRSPRA